MKFIHAAALKLFLLSLVIHTQALFAWDASSWHSFQQAKILAAATKDVLSNASLYKPFFYGSPIHENFPHLNAHQVSGFTFVKSVEATRLEHAARDHGLATFWVGPFPSYYVTDNDMRRALIVESKIGVIDDESEEHLKWMWKNNSVMLTFPAFLSINSHTHKEQRKYLLKQFHSGLRFKLADIEQSTKAFLDDFIDENGERPILLRDLITMFELSVSSTLLGLHAYPLDKLYREDESFRYIVSRIPLYGIAQNGDPQFEAHIYEAFLKIFERNFSEWPQNPADVTLIHNIFDSLDINFPSRFEDFFVLGADVRHRIAMNFAAVALGAMVHSTANTLNWLWAHILSDEKIKSDLSTLMAQAKSDDVTLTDMTLYDKKDGALFLITKLVLENVYRYPTFSHQFFWVNKAQDVKMPDGSTLGLNKNSLILVNYGAANRNNKKMNTPQKFLDALSDKDTVGRFVVNPDVASFGGSKGPSKLCPGAKLALTKNIIATAILFRDYDLQIANGEDLSLEIDHAQFPLLGRINAGRVVLSHKK